MLTPPTPNQSSNDGEPDLDRTIEKTAEPIADPTRTAYDDLATAYDFFNRALFGNRLPRCLITMQRCHGAYGYFAGDRFISRDGAEITDEIALNPVHFLHRTIEENLSTLAHEQVHLAQHHFGKPGKGGYHNKEWAAWMERIGLIPSARGASGGEQTGYAVGHLILRDGPFDVACRELLKQGFTIRYVERSTSPEDSELATLVEKTRKEARQRKAASKSPYDCAGCDVTAWAKPAVLLICGKCRTFLVARDAA